MMGWRTLRESCNNFFDNAGRSARSHPSLLKLDAKAREKIAPAHHQRTTATVQPVENSFRRQWFILSELLDRMRPGIIDAASCYDPIPQELWM
jgi:hypothetical protein